MSYTISNSRLKQFFVWYLGELQILLQELLSALHQYQTMRIDDVFLKLEHWLACDFRFVLYLPFAPFYPYPLCFQFVFQETNDWDLHMREHRIYVILFFHRVSFRVPKYKKCDVLYLFGYPILYYRNHQNRIPPSIANIRLDCLFSLLSPRIYQYLFGYNRIACQTSSLMRQAPAMSIRAGYLI